MKDKITKVEVEQVKETITKAAEKAGKIQPEKNMYIGPPTKMLPKYIIYEGGLPTYVKEHIKACPAMKSLFINPLELTEKQLELADSSSVAAMLYKKVEEYLNNEVK